jgi:hypothetical protein
MRFLLKSYLDSRPEKLLPYLPPDLVNLVVNKINPTDSDLFNFQIKYILLKTIDSSILFEKDLRNLLNTLNSSEHDLQQFVERVAVSDRYWDNPSFIHVEYDAFANNTDKTTKIQETYIQSIDSKFIYKNYNHLYIRSDYYKDVPTRKHHLLNFLHFMFELLIASEDKMNIFDLTNLIDTYYTDTTDFQNTFRILCMYFKQEYNILLPTTFSYMIQFQKISHIQPTSFRSMNDINTIITKILLDSAKMMHLDIIKFLWKFVKIHDLQEVLYYNIFLEKFSNIKSVPNTNALEWFLQQTLMDTNDNTVLHKYWWLRLHKKTNIQNPLIPRIEFILDLARKQNGNMYTSTFDHYEFLHPFFFTPHNFDSSMLKFAEIILRHPLYVNYNLDRIMTTLNELINQRNNNNVGFYNNDDHEQEQDYINTVTDIIRTHQRQMYPQ